MDVTLMDPRSISWEIDRPSYRVDLWWSVGSGGATSWRSEEYRVAGADFDEVRKWASGKGSEIFVVYLLLEDARGDGVIRLAGHDPVAAHD